MGKSLNFATEFQNNGYNTVIYQHSRTSILKSPIVEIFGSRKRDSSEIWSVVEHLEYRH